MPLSATKKIKTWFTNKKIKTKASFSHYEFPPFLLSSSATSLSTQLLLALCTQAFSFCFQVRPTAHKFHLFYHAIYLLLQTRVVVYMFIVAFYTSSFLCPPQHLPIPAKAHMFGSKT
jgi:hypothetical protein